MNIHTFGKHIVAANSRFSRAEALIGVIDLSVVGAKMFIFQFVREDKDASEQDNLACDLPECYVHRKEQNVSCLVVIFPLILFKEKYDPQHDCNLEHCTNHKYLNEHCTSFVLHIVHYSIKANEHDHNNNRIQNEDDSSLYNL